MLELGDPPTAIFAGSDMQAMGVYEAARRHRKRIPDDLSVVGFERPADSGWVYAAVTTTIELLAQMAVMADPDDTRAARRVPRPSSNRVELTTSVVRPARAPPEKRPAGTHGRRAGGSPRQPPAAPGHAAAAAEYARRTAPACGTPASPWEVLFRQQDPTGFSGMEVSHGHQGA